MFSLRWSAPLLLAIFGCVLWACGSNNDGDGSGGSGAAIGGSGATAGAGGDGGSGASIGVDCGNGVCDDDESCASCADDCGACPSCGAVDSGIDCGNCDVGCAAYWVSTTGDDNNDGSKGAPWATLQHALTSVSSQGGHTICVEDGTYTGTIDAEAEFVEQVWVKAVTPYRATLTAADNPVLDIGGQNIGFEGFEIVGSPTTGETTGLVYLFEADTITFLDNVIHDSYHNDVMRVLSSNKITLQCNVLYNQAEQEEIIDINGGSRNTIISDNIFFNDYVASNRTLTDPVQSMIVMKNSGGASPTTGAIFIQRNIFMHYAGGGHPHLRIGADGETYVEAEDVLVENNLFLYNGDEMNGAFVIMNAHNVSFVSNTMLGNATDDPFAGRFSGTAEGSPPSENAFFYNNLFARPDGGMAELIDSPAAEVTSGEMNTNLYWNGGGPIPTLGHLFDYTADTQAVLDDPGLTDPASATTPVWNGSVFGSQWASTRQAFEALVTAYGTPGQGSATIDAANASHAPADDVLGRPRGGAPDIGAVEVAP